ncbi:MAG TPA: PKD domain-containing protein [Bryobacteraceae bacterium]|nr:PKD domain-containing protein [Bryobacteraceae bacterium]
MRRFQLMMCIASFLGSSLLAARSAQAQLAGPLSSYMQLSNIADGTGSYVFGPGQTVAVDGVMPFVTGCLSMLEAGDKKPFFQIYPAADLYVMVDDGTPLVPLQTKLQDINGAPNTVIGLSDGTFVDAIVAITQPAGNTGAGKYRIVMDACQTGIWDPAGGDLILGDAYQVGFIVQEPAVLPPINLSPIKTSASQYVAALGDATIGGVTIPGACTLFKQVGSHTSLGSVLSGWFETSLAYCADLVGEYQGLADDPPDPDYQTFAELGDLKYGSAGPNTTPLERDAMTLANAMADQDAESNAFLSSLQKLEGAQQAGDDEWTMLQLMQMNKFINLLVGPGGSMLRTYAALEAFNVALQQDPLGDNADAQNFEAFLPTLEQTLGAMLTPLGGFFQPYVDSTGTLQVTPVGLQAYIEVYLGDSGDLVDLPGIPQERALEGLPPVVLPYPTANTGGNYNAPPGAAVTFNSSSSTDPNGGSLTYAWDLNGNGTFTDATGAQPQYTYSQPRTRTIAVKVTDSSGLTNIAYGLADIGDVTDQDIIAQSGYSQIYDIHSDGGYSQLTPGLPYGGANLRRLQVTYNGDIWSLDANTGLYHYDSNGDLLSTITPAQIGPLVGLKLLSFSDFAFDGSGRIDLTAREDFCQVTGISSACGVDGPGPGVVIRVAPDGSSATLLDQVEQPYGSVQLVNGVPTPIPGGPSGCEGIYGAGFIRVDPNTGKIIVSNVNNSDGSKCDSGVFSIDPTTAAVAEVIPAYCNYNGGGECPGGIATDPTYGSFYGNDLTFGGSSLHAGAYGGIAPQAPGLFVLDSYGNYIIAPSQLSGFIGRVDVPPQITNVGGTLDINTFPVAENTFGGDLLNFGAMTVDAGGDYVGAGINYNQSLTPALFRLAPDGEIFNISTSLSPPNGYALVDVVPQTPAVTPSDMPAPPAITLINFNVGQASCPSSAQFNVTVDNTGNTATPSPVQVFFFDGDPSLGIVAGIASTGAPVPAGGSVKLSVPWASPSPGTHELFALALGANTVNVNYIVCVSAQYSANPLLLSPAAGKSTTGQTYTVTAQLVDVFGGGIAGAPTTFTVSGANSATGTVTTDANGYAQFSYTGTNPGLDNISATAFSASSNQVTNTWQGALAAQTITFGVLPNVTYGAAPTTLTATASSGLPVSYSVTGPAMLSGSVLTITGTGSVIVTASQPGNASYAAAAPVSQSFTVLAPVVTVTAPASISIPATQAGGATGAAWPTLSAFLGGASATGGSGSPLVQLAPQVNGIAVNNGTLFPIGTTTVTFRFADPIGDTGTATSTVTVAIGVPRITGASAGVGTDPSGAIYVNVVLTNTGTGNAESLQITSLTLRTLGGTGTVTYDTALSPSLPITIGVLDVGAAVSTRVYLNVPATVTRISVTENGPVQDVTGTNYNYSTAESLIP